MNRGESTFRQLVNPGSIAALEAEVNLDENRFREMTEEYARLRADMTTLGASINRQRALITAIRGALSEDAGEVAPRNRPAAEKMSKREIATEVLGLSIRPLFPREVRQIAIEKGWLPSDRAAANQLSVAMAKGVRSDVFVRDDDGRYSLPRGT